MHRISRHWADYLYVLPALLVMLVVIGYPLIYTVWLSFHATPPRTGEWVFNGTQNYQDILSDPRFWRITMNTVYWTVGSTCSPSFSDSGQHLRYAIHSEAVASCGPCC